jgi:predicted metal-dependent hydrolase
MSLWTTPELAARRPADLRSRRPQSVDENFFADAPILCPRGWTTVRTGTVQGMAAEVEVRRSRRRRRTVSAYRDGGRTVVLIPARFTRSEEAEWVAAMVKRLEAQDRRRRPSDATLARRARELSDRYLGAQARPTSVAWVSNQNSRWGSCTPLDGTIRISSRVQGMPSWVIDYVLLHELAHLIEPRHGADFWALLASYPRTERARGYLEGVSAASGLDVSDRPDDGVDDGVTG